MQLTTIQLMQGSIELLSGLRIGASDGEMHIGGVDQQVIRNPINRQPYIPGSSLKGKMRSLLEWRSGAVQPEPLGKAALQGRHAAAVKPILQLFGVGGGEMDEKLAAELGPSRLSFWDAAINAAWLADLDGDSVVEVKTENRIDRIRGVAEHPRQTERVAAGTRFDFRLSIKVLDIDGDGDALLATVLAGMRLMELDSLGGSGSRGYGKIRFTELRLGEIDIQERFKALDPFAAVAA